MKAPCKDCTERQLGCHAECEKYNTFRQRHRQETIKINKEKAVANNWRSFRHGAYMKHIKGHTAKKV